MFAAIRWWRSETASLRCKSPFLHICFDEDETHLPKIDMYLARTIRAECWKEVLCFQTMCYIVQLLAITCEENSAGSRSISDANYIALNVCRTVSGRSKRLVVSA